ncbi:MAG: succinylglutamate desuccinylase/aspartoacylase family protein [Candidatus Electryonea clarkiae]|nr:succinylglutamate desuccinylase/aspartoacylase family protein [Candidatus Electryonea clarkiae]
MKYISNNIHDRQIGEYHGIESGACIVIVAGLHGNEPTGINAIQEIFSTISENQIPIKGDIFAYRGNVSALKEGRRYLDKDLNRIWKKKLVDQVSTTKPNQTLAVEEKEQLELLSEIEKAISASRGDTWILDLHTSSAAGPPFILGGQGNHVTERVENILHVSVIIDTPGYFSGAMLNHYHRKGLVSFAFEAGQHNTKQSIEVNKEAIWRVLLGLGSTKIEFLPDSVNTENLLKKSKNGIPTKIELIYRHAVSKEDHFKMLPGFRNFDQVEQGQILGHDKRGEVQSPEKGMIFLPLYQEIGEDGFFIVRELRE